MLGMKVNQDLYMVRKRVMMRGDGTSRRSRIGMTIRNTSIPTGYDYRVRR